MKKDAIRIATALIVLAGMIGFLAWHRQKVFIENEQEEAASKLVSLTEKELGKVVLQTRTGSVVFERRTKDPKGDYADGWALLSVEYDSIPEWKIVSPYKALPDYHSMNTLFTNLANLSSEKSIDKEGKNPDQYNLKDPPLQIELFKTGETKESFVVKVGESNSADTGLYVRTSKSPEIILADRSLNYLKDRMAEEWRKKEVIGFKDLSALTRVEWSYGEKGQESIVAVQKKGEWNLEKPSALPADDQVIKTFVSDLKSMRASSIPTEDWTKDSKAYGFLNPYAEFTIFFEHQGKDHRRTIIVGNRFEADKDIYVRRADFPQIFAVRGSLKKALTKNVKDLVSKAPIRSTEAAMAELSFQKSGEAKTVMVKKEKGWVLSKPMEDQADSTQVSALLETLTNLKAEEYLGDKVSQDSKEETLEIIVTSADRTEKIVWVDPGKEKDAFLQAYEPSRAYRFKRKDYDDIEKAVSNLRQKNLLPVARNDLASIRITKGSLDVNYIRSPDAKWVLGSVLGAEPTLKAKLREKSTADILLGAVEGLRIETFLKEKPSDLKDTILTLEFRPKEGESVSWAFGSKSGDKVKVGSVERKAVGELSKERLEQIESALTLEDPKKG